VKEKISEFKEKISEIEKQISSLSVQKENLIKELSSLSQERNIQPLNPSSDSVGQPVTLQFSTAEKVKLFRAFFHGRNDVYARLWKSKKTGKLGYSPVCKNEWIRGICKKPQLKCSECPNRELVSVDDNVIYNHLAGEYIVGIYPMLQNENCYFLAIDFDKKSWQDDAFAFKETCLQEGIPASIERSRSGNGAHVWIFFKDEVPAFLARRLGTFLISKTMNRRFQLDMQSYDRLFPNQDTLPQGGFGNLIALPLQKEATKQGNSIFIDDSCTPHFDQWGFISSLEKMSLSEVEKITKEASHKSQIIGARMSPTEEKDPPWMLLPSGRKRYKPNIPNLPESISIVVANRIYIKTDKVPSILLNQLKQLAAFQNPEFYKRQNMRFSTFATPRIICCAEILDEYLALPRGCLEDVNCLLKEHGVKLNIGDESTSGEKVNFKFHGSLVKAQKKSLRKILKKRVGIFVAPPGSGKTVVAINAIASRKTNTLILVHRKPLMEQWRLQLASFLNIDTKEIGRFGSGKNNMMGNIDIAMIQSMERKGVVDDRIAEYGFIIVDECHHIGAVSFERVLMQAKAKYVLGLTATPYRRDGHQPVIHMQCGSIVHQIREKDIDKEIDHYQVYPRITTFKFDYNEGSNIYDLWPGLISNIQRNEMIVKDIIASVENGRFPIILTERKEHIQILEEMLSNHIRHLAVVHGGVRVKKRKEVLEALRNCSEDVPKALLATGSYIGEGFDEPRLDTLFIAMPVSFKGKMVQYAGRLNRQHYGKNNVCIYDYVDDKVSVLERMYQKRLKSYKAMGYTIQK